MLLSQAIKIVDKEKIRRQHMGTQIKREVNIMKQMKDKNPHVVSLHEVLASKTKIYLVSENNLLFLTLAGYLFHYLLLVGIGTGQRRRIV